MSVRKRYQSLTGTQYTFPVKVDGKIVWISFNGSEHDYFTSNPSIQAALESHPKFVNGSIGLVGSKEISVPVAEKKVPAVKTTKVEVPVVEEESPAGKSVRTFPDVTDINGAVAVLKSEPYAVHHMSLRSKEAVLAKAKENGVSFPNWAV